MKRKKILLCWPESSRRSERLKAFVDISDEIEFVHLFFRTREERLDPYSPFKMIYWFDYTSPYKLLDDIKPDKVVMANVASLLNISLAAACKKRGILIYGMQHGYMPENIEDIYMEISRPGLFKADTWRRYIRILRFYFGSIQPFSLKYYWQYILLAFYYFRKGHMLTMKRFQYEWRKPDFFLCFTKYSGKFYADRDRLSDERILEIGIPVFDPLLQVLHEKKDKVSPENHKPPYYLLIDTVFTESKITVSPEKIKRCYKTLAEYCKKHDAILKIKLHPHNYFNDKLPVIDGISYYKNLPNDDLAELILGARAGFAFYSTLSLPVMCYKKLCQINKSDVYFNEWVTAGITPVIDFETFEVEDIKIDEFKVNTNNLQKLIAKYLHKADGKATDLLKQILLGAPKTEGEFHNAY